MISKAPVDTLSDSYTYESRSSLTIICSLPGRAEDTSSSTDAHSFRAVSGWHPCRK